MKAIVNVSKNWGIGKDGDLLVYIPEDMKFFRTTTKGGTVIMGRKTLESFPGGRPLSGRLNIVLSRDRSRVLETLGISEAESAGSAAAASESAKEPAGYAGKNEQASLGYTLDDKGTRILVCGSMEEILNLGEAVLGDAFVIGGAEIYRRFLPYCDECLVTVNDSSRDADSYFPNLDESSDWTRIRESEEQVYEGIRYRFTTYRHIGVKREGTEQ